MFSSYAAETMLNSSRLTRKHANLLVGFVLSARRAGSGLVNQHAATAYLISQMWLERCARTKLRSPNRRRFAPLCLIIFSVLLSNAERPIDAQSAQNGRTIKSDSTQESPRIATQLINLVRGYIAAGDASDPAARGKYLAPNVFYYGHPCTRQEAIREIASLYRRWPQRKFVSTDSIDLFKIPDHRGAYRADALYEYHFDNFNEHLSGKSQMTFVIEQTRQGVRIIGVDEKLVNDSTSYQKE
jgi:hypothetical protein